MNASSYSTRFSVVCLPENPRLFMMNMQVFQIQPATAPLDANMSKPEAIVWCAVFQGPVIKKT